MLHQAGKSCQIQNTSLTHSLWMDSIRHCFFTRLESLAKDKHSNLTRSLWMDPISKCLIIPSWKFLPRSNTLIGPILKFQRKWNFVNLFQNILNFFNRDRRLVVGDEIVNVNGRRLRGLPMAEAKAILRSRCQSYKTFFLCHWPNNIFSNSTCPWQDFS